MRILIITTRFAPHLGGVETVVEELAQRFSDEGHEVSVLASMDLNSNTGVINKFFGIETKSIQYKNFTLKRIWMEWPSSVLGYLLYPVRLILSVIALSNYIKGFNPEVINFHFPDSASIYLRIALSNKQLPLVVNVHGNDLHVFSKKHPYKFFIEWLVSKASRLIVNSDYMLNELKGRFNNINEKITKIPNGLDLETFDKIEPRKYFDEEYIFYVGRLVKKKGIDILLKAFVEADLGDTKLLIEGSGEEKENLEELIKALKLEDKVTMTLGNLSTEDKIALMKGSVFGVVPSRIEPFGIVALEYMAAGTPLIASNTGGLASIIQDNYTGLLYENESIEELAYKMKMLLSDSNLREKIRNNAKDEVRKYGWENIVQRYLDVYKEVV